MLRRPREHRDRTAATCLATCWRARSPTAAAIVARNELFTAFVPFAARWPVEVHIYPNRFVHNLVELNRRRAGRVRADIPRCAAGGSTGCIRLPLPYISALHQYRRTDARRRATSTSS